MNWNDLVKRLKNPGTVISLVSLVILILTTNGVQIDNEKVMTTVKAVCSILMILGIMNNAESPGLDIPGAKNENKK